MTWLLEQILQEEKEKQAINLNEVSGNRVIEDLRGMPSEECTPFPPAQPFYFSYFRILFPRKDSNEYNEISCKKRISKYPFSLTKSKNFSPIFDFQIRTNSKSSKRGICKWLPLLLRSFLELIGPPF